MNKLITTNNGGYPFVLDDLRFVDESVRDSLKAILRPYGGTTYSNGFIVSLGYNPGDVYAGGTTIPETSVFMNGEIWTLPAFTLPTNISNNYVWIVPDISLQAGAPSAKVLQNGTTVNTYETRRAKHVFSNAGGTGGYPGQFPAFRYDLNEGGWIMFDNANFKYLQNQLSGLNATVTNLGTLSQTVNTHTTEIATHESRLDTIDAPWTTISGNALKPLLGYLYQNGSANSPAVFGAPVGSLDPTSFIKFKKIGKTIFLNVNIENFVLPKPDASGSPATVVSSIMLDLYNFGITTINSNVSGTLHVSERNMPSVITNIAFVKRYNVQTLYLILNNYGSESNGAWNYVYRFNTYSTNQVDRAGSGVPFTTDYTKWSIRGSFHFEID